MGTDKKSFLLFMDLHTPVQKLSNEDAGKLFKAIFEYQNGGIEQDLSKDADMAFTFIKQQLDRSEEKYMEMCERNRLNGSRGGRPKNPLEPKKPSGLNGLPKNPTKPTLTLPDSDPHSNPKSKKDIKHHYGEYKNIPLTETQFTTLGNELTVKTRDGLIEKMSSWMKANGKTYKSYPAALKNWAKREPQDISKNKIITEFEPIDF